jgi:short-subunit dehydrogenase
MATWCVTGAARGLGYEIALHALEAGANVVATARSLSQVEAAFAAEVEAVFATNVFGLLNVTRAVLPHMRAARAGHVVNISSMGGFAQVAGWGVYGATKFFRFQVGPDAVAMVEDKLTRVRDELEAWRPLASSTLFTDTADSKSA